MTSQSIADDVTLTRQLCRDYMAYINMVVRARIGDTSWPQIYPPWIFFSEGIYRLYNISFAWLREVITGVIIIVSLVVSGMTGKVVDALLTLIPAWINNQIHYKVWDEITCPFPNFNGETVEVWEGINSSPHTLQWIWLPIHVGLNLIHVSKDAHRNFIY